MIKRINNIYGYGAPIVLRKKILNIFMLGILFYFILIDSGGPIGVRYISFLYFFTIFLLYFFKRKSKNIMIFDFLILFMVCTSFFVALVNNISLAVFYKWVYFFVFIIIMPKALLFFKKDEKLESILMAGFLFFISVLLVFLSMLNKIPIISQVILDNIFSFPGWFYMKNIGGVSYPHVYFQATLTMVPIAILAYILNKKIIFFLLCLTLLEGSSRFGFAAVLLFVFLIRIFGVKKISKFIVINFIPFSIVIVVFSAIIYFSISNYVTDGGSLNTRIGHLVSIFNNSDVCDLFFGQGAGSTFFSIGSNKVVDNVELTQLEFVRKFGILVYSVFHIMIFYILYKLHEYKEYAISIFIFSFYFTSMSNPVLTSMSFSFILSLGISVVYENEFSKGEQYEKICSVDS